MRRHRSRHVPDASRTTSAVVRCAAPGDGARTVRHYRGRPADAGDALGPVATPAHCGGPPGVRRASRRIPMRRGALFGICRIVPGRCFGLRTDAAACKAAARADRAQDAARTASACPGRVAAMRSRRPRIGRPYRGTRSTEPLTRARHAPGRRVGGEDAAARAQAYVVPQRRGLPRSARSSAVPARSPAPQRCGCTQDALVWQVAARPARPTQTDGATPLTAIVVQVRRRRFPDQGRGRQ